MNGDGIERSGYVKREFDCGHWILIPDYFARADRCKFCPGEFVQEVEPEESDFREVEWV